jgi:hypothetical protein
VVLTRDGYTVRQAVEDWLEHGLSSRDKATRDANLTPPAALLFASTADSSPHLPTPPTLLTPKQERHRPAVKTRDRSRITSHSLQIAGTPWRTRLDGEAPGGERGNRKPRP